MQVRALFLLCLGLLACMPAFASAKEKPENASPSPLPRREAEDDRLSFEFGVYRQTDGTNDSGGNRNIDENETVYEAIILLDKAIKRRDRLQVRFLGDIVSSASEARYHNAQYRTLQSNPSGNKHAEIKVGWQRKFDRFTLGTHASFGAEYSNYYSFGYGAQVSAPFLRDNTTLSLLLQGYTDYFQVKLFDGTEPGFDTRQTITGEIGITQVLSPTTLLNLAFNYTQQLGYLGTTFNSVFVNGTEFGEAAPSSRRRNAVAARVKQSLSPLNALEMGYRLYNDSWDINSHTLETRYFHYLFRKRLLLEPNYRLYLQDAASFYQPEFTALPAHRTSDPDLGNFDGHIFGMKFTLIRLPFPKWNGDLNLTYNYYLRTDDLRIYWITTGYLLRF